MKAEVLFKIQYTQHRQRRLSVVGEAPFGDDIESAVEVDLVRAGRLRQSVLRSAFEGRL